MNAIARFRSASHTVSLTLLLLTYPAPAQEFLPATGQNGNWDISVWIVGATGEENRNSLTEAQIWTAGAFIGKVITSEIGSGWRRGNLEYGFDLILVFVQSRTETVYGGGFDPLVLRWNSSRHIGRVLPYVELAGGAVFTTSNLPPGDTSSLNFAARGRWRDSHIHPEPAIIGCRLPMVAHLKRQLGSAQSRVQRCGNQLRLPLVQIGLRQRAYLAVVPLK